MAHPHLPGLDSMSEHTSGSLVISLIPTIKISQTDVLRFDSMIGNSDDSNDGLVENSGQFSPTNIQTNNAVENEQKPKVSLLINSKYHIDNNLYQKNKLPHHKDSVDVSGISALINMSNLSENIPLNISIDAQQLFSDASTEDIQVATALTDSEVGDFSPSDESEFDPKTVDYDSDDSLKPPFNDKFNNLMIERLEKKRKIISKQLQEENITENGEDRTKNLMINEKKIMTKENPDSSEFTIEKDTKKITKKRKWDRRNACFYCQAIVTNYSRHLLRKHPDEFEIQQYKAINDDDLQTRKRKRQEITDKLRNKGNFLHNSKVTFDRDTQSILLPSKRRNQGTSSPSAYATCKTCLGTFKRVSFFRHLRNCRASKNIIPSLKTKALFNHSLTIVPNTASASTELKEKILSHLRSDEISLIVKNDPLILAYGARLLKKKKERRSRKAICSKMRDLATLLTFLRKNDENIENLTDAIDPEKYETFLDAIKEMCGFDEQKGMVKIISVPARMRPAVLGCVEILYTQSIMQNDTSTAYKEAYKKKPDDFKRLIEINWEWEISLNAEKSRKRKHLTKEIVMPLESDIKTVMEKIHKLEIKYATKLRTDRCVLNYELLCMVTIAHIIMLDRKRSGDVAEAELAFYINRKTEEVPEKVLQTLTEDQRKCIKNLDVFQIPGKRTRGVPILLTKIMRQNIDLLIACREDLKIPNNNPYLFARPNTQEPFDGGKCLDMIKKQCNLKRPEMITSTGMRHHIATMSQIHATQKDHYTEQLAGFLGHNISVHSQNYRLPLQVLQKAVVGAQLMEYENTSTVEKDQGNKNVLEGKNLEMESKQPNILVTDPKINIEIPETIVKNTTKKLRIGDNKLINDKTRESDSEDDKPIQTKSKVKRTNSPDHDLIENKRNKKCHRKWSDAEIKLVKKYFQTYIDKKKNPGKNKCEEVLRKEPIFRNRSWMQLNSYVNNIYKKK